MEATFFTLKHRDRAVLLPATMVFVLIVAALIAIFAAINWGTLVEVYRAIITAKQPGALQDDAAAVRMVGRVFLMIGTMILLLLPFYLVVAAYEAACLRWMIRGEAPGWSGLLINADTWRVYGIYWCWFLGQMAISTAASIITFPFMMAAMTTMTDTANPMAMVRSQMGVQMPLMLVQYVALIFLGVRFAPAAASSIASKEFVFFRAWQVTQGRFWALLGSFALIWLIAGVVFLGAFAFAAGGILGIAMTHWQGAQSEIMIGKIFSPTSLILLGLCYMLCIITTLAMALINFGINAHAALAAVKDGKLTPETRPSAPAAA